MNVSKLFSNLMAFTAIAFISVIAIAQNSATIDGTCRLDQHDLFDKGWRLTKDSGKYAEQCLNTRKHRPIVILSENEDEIVFANFFHNDQYWTAKWKKNDVPKVEFTIIHFGSGIPMLNYIVHPAHTEMRFQLPFGLDLVSQKNGQISHVQDFTISWEAVSPANAGYSFLTGMKKNYAIIGRATSTSSQIKEHTNTQGQLRKSFSYNLNLTSKQSQLVVINSLHESNRVGFSEFYLTLPNNCTTKLFDTLDTVLRSTRGAQENTFRRFKTPLSPDPIAGPSRRALLSRGLIESNQKPIDVAKHLGMESE